MRNIYMGCCVLCLDFQVNKCFWGFFPACWWHFLEWKTPSTFDWPQPQRLFIRLWDSNGKWLLLPLSLPARFRVQTPDQSGESSGVRHRHGGRLLQRQPGTGRCACQKTSPCLCRSRGKNSVLRHGQCGAHHGRDPLVSGKSGDDYVRPKGRPITALCSAEFRSDFQWARWVWGCRAVEGTAEHRKRHVQRSHWDVAVFDGAVAHRQRPLR